MADMEPTGPLVHEYRELVALLDRRAVIRAALAMLNEGGDVSWLAERLADDSGSTLLVIDQLWGDRTGLLRGLPVPNGQGLTGKVHDSGDPSWVDDYFQATDITHTFDDHIRAEGIRRLLAVPVQTAGTVHGVLAVGSRSDGTFGDRAVARAHDVAQEAAVAMAVAERARMAREIAVHEERSRLAAELHDSVGALLFAIGSGVAGLAESAVGDPQLSARLQRLRSQANEASTALRESLRTLRASPAVLALSVALRGDCSAFTDRTAIPAELVILDDLPVLSTSRSEVLVAGVREALLNVEKHAQASAVVVTAAARPGGGLVIAVTDDGVGLPTPHEPGIGLSSTADAAGRLGGSVRVDRNPDGGTTWRIGLPC